MILVVGATGTLGGIVTRRLLGQGLPVRILVRPQSNYQALVAAGAQPVTGDLKDRASLDTACQGVEMVITTANSALRGGDDNPLTVEKQGNRSLIEAAKAAGTVKQFVFVSVSGFDPDSPIPFIAGKGQTEVALRQSGLPYTIIAPGPFAEVWLGMVVLAPLAQGMPVTLIGKEGHKQSFISIQDVASFIIASLGNSKAINQRLLLGGPEPVSFYDAARVFGKLLNCEPRIVSVNPGDLVPTIPPAVTPLMIGLSLSDWSVPMEEIANTFNVRLTSLEEVAQGMLQPH